MHTTAPNGHLALEMLARMSPEGRPVKAAALEASTPTGGGWAGGMLDDDGLQRLADKVRAVHQAHAQADRPSLRRAHDSSPTRRALASNKPMPVALQ
ncbi:hypothetical protein [Streptosporangium sp. NPDC049046]|uniref:hypothetical protein n=1 Tax=Streptosporangium sp. NPDC049046 TaxID=3155031 RepID=UPI0034272AC6